MTPDDRRSLAPMEAIEFAIDRAFRHFFLALGLVIAWALLLSPLIALAWYTTFRSGPPDWKALPPSAMAALAALGLGVLLAAFSIMVSWHRRILLDERPRGLRRWRLDGAVWRTIAGFLLVVVVLGLYAAAGFGILTRAVPMLGPQLGPAAKPVGIALTVLLGLSGLFTFWRLLSWLGGLAAGDRGYTLGTAWRATRGNRIAYLGFTFWLLFSLGIAGGIGAGAFFAQANLPQPWVKPAAFALMALIGWLALFLLASVPPAHYRAFAGGGKPEDETAAPPAEQKEG